MKKKVVPKLRQEMKVNVDIVTSDDIIFYYFGKFQVALQILGRKFYENTKKSSLYAQSLLIFIHETRVVENHPTTGEIRKLLRRRSTPTGIAVYFYMSSSLIFILELHRRNLQTLHLMKTLWKIIPCFSYYGI